MLQLYYLRNFYNVRGFKLHLQWIEALEKLTVTRLSKINPSQIHNEICQLLISIFKFEQHIFTVHHFLCELYPEYDGDLPDLDILFPYYRDIEISIY